MSEAEPEEVELEVTLTFGVLVQREEGESLQQLALSLRDDWTENTADLIAYFNELGDDFTLQVKTPHEL